MAEAAKKAEVVEALKKQICEKVILFEHKEGSKLVDLKEIPTLVRSLGYNPSGTQANMVNSESHHAIPPMPPCHGQLDMYPCLTGVLY